MIIDCHGHYTTAPKALGDYRQRQKARLAEPGAPALAPDVRISDDEIRDSLEPNQLATQRGRGVDMTVLSPMASAMAHHVGNEETSRHWTQACNDLVHRVTQLYPRAFAGVCQLPQSPRTGLSASVAELERCVTELGFVGCNINPDPTDGMWTDPPMTDRHWYPLYEKMVELDVPGMVHVSCSCNPNFHHTGAHYLNADTAVFMQLVLSDVFKDFPGLRLVIPHGGGAVPYHWGRYRGLAQQLGRPPMEELLRNVFFDTCVYHQPGVDLLLEVVPVENVLFASEIHGAVKGVDPRTGFHYDDTRRYVDAVQGLGPRDLHSVFEGNARRVYPRLDALLRSQGR
ncbi:4-oxalomesaconate hydratase [Pseudorhodoferax aquiterrae]|uniref:4-oxalomesaconate hydratase n=1 Tax=Pseudorhodoferax aquiterrae TaxID=747304 RepID=A0ABQ3FYW0_9BURK|nr:MULTISPECIES: amidohydrolase family protein [Comamonadaceae]GHC77392.1 4-oxalomesaconate hydratase [Pseudorhodoferax aquiterrae]